MPEDDIEIAMMEREMMKESLKKQWLTKIDIAKVVKEMPLGFVELDGEELAFKKILTGTIGILIPSEFDLMNQVELEWKYPYTERADFIFSDNTTTRNISLMPLEVAIADEQFEEFSNAIFSNLRRTKSELTIISEEINVDNDNQPIISYFDATMPTLDNEAYVFFGVTSLENEVVLFSFTCPKQEYEFWYPLCVAMLKTMTAEREDDASESE